MASSAELEAAYGGTGWSPRTTSSREEIGTIWTRCGVTSETSRLEAVLLHRPGPELEAADPNDALMLDRPDAHRAADQHDALAATYRSLGVEVLFVDPPAEVATPPNLIFAADLFFMTPEGAILGRPASTVRAGEERWVARRLANAGIPILHSVRGSGVFEGADALWLAAGTVLLGRGLRTNDEGAAQVAAVLRALGVDVVYTDLPRGTMHLMGQVRFLDSDLAVVREERIDATAASALRDAGYDVVVFPDRDEMDRGFAHNFVTAGPREVVMPAGCPETQAFYESFGVRCHTVAIDEIAKAAGGIGCLTGVLRRSGT